MNIDDFGNFFEELHSSDEHRLRPFPWQNQLMKRVVEKGWPKSIDLPTSAGKTATLDIALFHMALEADKPPQERRAPIRIYFVVDRRIVVDEAYERSCRICNCLNDAHKHEYGILSDVAHRLVKLASVEDSKPLEVVRLRGGLPLERAFIRNPLQPTIVLSTVDQIGSRLLFRGYGVSQFMRPIHAALVGMNSIIILDEAHLSQPFMDTLDKVKHYQSEVWAEKLVVRPTNVLQMTATPSGKSEDVFSPLDDMDDENWNHNILGPRLTCAKPAELVTIDGDKDDPDATRKILTETLAKEATSLMSRTRDICETPVIGVVANRVATARQVFEQLRIEEDTDALLLTGRIRPFDRDVLLKDYLRRIKAGRAKDVNKRPLYVVATQTVEVGADIDFDAFVTEAAALDALRQRFGRLNRFGKRDHAKAVVVYVNFGRSKVTDPVYGDALAETWNWMCKIAKKPRGQKRKVIDFGIHAMKEVLPTEDDITKILTPKKTAPVLMPAHVDMLVQTSPVPAVEPEVALYLHGVDTKPEDVQIVWRADLPDKLELDDEDTAIAIVSVLPPTQLETLAIPVRAARAILAKSWNENIDVSDVEGGGEEGISIENTNERYVIRWAGADDSNVIRHSNDVRPGDILVMPSSYGGLDRFGWNPTWDLPVRDIGDETALIQRGKLLLRIHKNLIPLWFEGQERTAEAVSEAFIGLKDVLVRFDEEEDLSELSDELIENLLTLPHIKEVIRNKLIKLQSGKVEKVYPDKETANGMGILLQEAKNSLQSFADDDYASSLTSDVILYDHCKGVAELVSTFAFHCGISDELATDLSIAGKLHDIGKADPRFQAWLRGGDKIAMRNSDKILAKSTTLNVDDRNSIRLARKMAGYPKGTRHECYSAAMALRNEWLSDGSDDKDLLLYLIGVHHGRGRPLMPTTKDDGCHIKFEFEDKKVEFCGRHNLEQLDSGWPDRFWQLNRRYGYWGLAYLETLVRLADHRRSEQGE